MDETCYNILLYATFAKEHMESRAVVKVIERKFGKNWDSYSYKVSQKSTTFLFVLVKKF